MDDETDTVLTALRGLHTDTAEVTVTEPDTGETATATATASYRGVDDDDPDPDPGVLVVSKAVNAADPWSPTAAELAPVPSDARLSQRGRGAACRACPGLRGG